jgi:hypothetical protein
LPKKCRRPIEVRVILWTGGETPAGAEDEMTMQYLLMLHAEEGQWAKFSAEEQARHLAAYGAFTQALANEGRLVASSRLALSDAARTVRTKGGKTVVMDGPFAETKEQVAGFYLIEAEDMDAAAAWAARCPAAGHGVIEVRPLWTTQA